MISKRRLLLSLLFFLAPSLCFGYIFPVRTYTSVPSNTDASVVGQKLAFEVLKLSLSKNNISYTFSTYGLGTTFIINGLTDVGTGFSGAHVSYSDTVWVVLWPRTNLDSNGVCDCDYTVFGTFYQYYAQAPTNPSSNAYYYYVYFDSGVVTVTNYLGSFYNTGWENKNVVLNTSLSCSMPFDYDGTHLINYFIRPTRLLNLTQSGTVTSPSSFRFGSVVELFSYQFRYSFLQGCGNNNNVQTESKWFDLRTKQEIVQSALPWQLQIYNPSFDTSAHTKPTEQFSADTDAGSEPDISEYYTGHDYLNDPSDDWGQPADIGGGGSGSGGEVTGFSQGAQGQMTGSTQNAMENYFGDPTDTDLDLVTLPTGEDEFDERDDIDLESTWLTQTQGAISGSQTGVATALPDGVAKFQQIVNALKTPDNRNLPVITLPFRFDLSAFHHGTIIDVNNKPTIDFSIIKQAPFDTYYNSLRQLVVLFLAVCVVIYILKDTLFMGNKTGDD